MQPPELQTQLEKVLAFQRCQKIGATDEVVKLREEHESLYTQMEKLKSSQHFEIQALLGQGQAGQGDGAAHLAR